MNSSWMQLSRNSAAHTLQKNWGFGGWSVSEGNGVAELLLIAEGFSW